MATRDENETAGATAGDDTEGLIQTQLTTKAARDAAEWEAIDEAYNKYIHRSRRKKLQDDWLSDGFIRRVHLDMFGEIWDWAGKYRRKILNLGMDPHLIPEQVQQLCGHFNYWNSPASSMEIVEIAARLQNRLTRIHPFRNGNGRHARLMTDIFFNSRGHKLPQWPQIQLITHGDKIRERYIAAMRAADKEDYGELIAIMKEWID
jgi:Fic-DOC domain mobile mystery protein B